MKKPRVRHVLAGVITGLIGVAIGAGFAAYGVRGAFARLVHVIEPADAIAFWTAMLAMGTFGLVAVAYKGLKSLGLTKHDVVTRAMRDARTAAVLRAEEWAHAILPANADIIELSNKESVVAFVKEAKEVAFDPDSVQHLEQAQAWWGKLSLDLRKKITSQVNDIEAWAMYFKHELADDGIAYGPIAPTFFAMVVQYYPLLLISRASESGGNFPNIVALFKAWLARKTEEERLALLESAVQRVGLFTKAGPSPSQFLGKPLGTDLKDL